MILPGEKNLYTAQVSYRADMVKRVGLGDIIGRKECTNQQA